MKTTNSVFKLFKIAKFNYKKLAEMFSHHKSKEDFQPISTALYSHKIYANISDYYFSNPAKSILRSLEHDYTSDEITKIQDFINSLILKTADNSDKTKEKFDFDNIQNYVINSNYKIR